MSSKLTIILPPLILHYVKSQPFEFCSNEAAAEMPQNKTGHL